MQEEKEDELWHQRVLNVNAASNIYNPVISLFSVFSSLKADNIACLGG